ncbi:MAG TPA: hypothetical protein VJT83_05185, partial [Chitinophagaceae bacterium]|nr:hypothetical protein [Chitinophagaceae bacterium]
MIFRELIERYLNQQITEAEKKELAEMLKRAEYQLELAELIDSGELEQDFSAPSAVKEETYRRIMRRISVRKLHIGRWVAAAALIILVGTWYFVGNRQWAVGSKEEIVLNDIKAPDSTKATITLANGKVIVPRIINGQIVDSTPQILN